MGKIFICTASYAGRYIMSQGQTCQPKTLAHCQLWGLTDEQDQNGLNCGRIPFEELPVRENRREVNRAGRVDSVREGRLRENTSDFLHVLRRIGPGCGGSVETSQSLIFQGQLRLPVLPYSVTKGEQPMAALAWRNAHNAFQSVASGDLVSHGSCGWCQAANVCQLL